MATVALKEIMTCPLCGGPIKLVGERKWRLSYEEVECDGTCLPCRIFSVPPWFDPFFAQHFENLLEMNRAFFEKYDQSFSPVPLGMREKLLLSRISDREESVPIR